MLAICAASSLETFACAEVNTFFFFRNLVCTVLFVNTEEVKYYFSRQTTSWCVSIGSKSYSQAVYYTRFLGKNGSVYNAWFEWKSRCALVLNFALAFSEIIYACVKQLLETNECFFTPLLSIAYKSLFDYRFSSSC